MKEEPEEAPVHEAFGGLTGEMQERVAPDIPARAGSGSQRDAGSVAMPTDGAETDVYGEDAFDAGRGESEPARREPARHTPASGSKVGAADDGKPVTACLLYTSVPAGGGRSAGPVECGAKRL